MTIDKLRSEILACKLCQDLPLGPRPVLQIDDGARLLIAGQAPGLKVHEIGIPFDDASGKRLKEWLGLSNEQFYDAGKVAILPMGFCYPGTGKQGDLAPRPECAQAWREKVLKKLRHVRLTVCIGTYAQAYHLGSRRKPTLTETIRAWKEYAPEFFPLPHPSPRNNIWLKKNPWFEQEVLPELKVLVRAALSF